MQETEYIVDDVRITLRTLAGPPVTPVEGYIEYTTSEPTCDDGIFELPIELEIAVYPEGTDVEEYSGLPPGELEFEFRARIEGEKGEFDRALARYADGGYEALPQQVAYQIESGILSQVLAPAEPLVDSSIRGFLPRMVFSETARPGAVAET